MILNSKNLAITMVLVFLVFNHFIGLAWEVVKTLIYCVLFMFLLKHISPDLYNYLMNIVDIKNFKFSNIPKTFISFVKKIMSLIPFINQQCPKDKVKVKEETESENQ